MTGVAHREKQIAVAIEMQKGDAFPDEMRPSEYAVRTS
jgi:hypothetical protein